MTRRHLRQELPPRFAQDAFHAVSNDGRADGAGNGETKAWIADLILLPRKPVQDEIAGGRRGTAPVDGVEVTRPRKPVAALHSSSAQSRNPLARIPVARKPLKASASRPLCLWISRQAFHARPLARTPVARKPLKASASRPLCLWISSQALGSCALRRTAACVLSRDDASGWSDPRARPFVLETHAAACGGERSAGRCVSRFSGVRREMSAGGAGSIDEGLCDQVFHSPRTAGCCGNCCSAEPGVVSPGNRETVFHTCG